MNVENFTEYEAFDTHQSASANSSAISFTFGMFNFDDYLIGFVRGH